MIELLTFLLCVIILFILILAVALSIYIYDLIRNYITDTVESVSRILPNNIEYEYTQINFNHIDQRILLSEINHTKKAQIHSNIISQFLIYCNMAAYNLYGNYEVIFPNYMIIEKNISNIGYVFKLTGVDEDIHVFTFRGTRTGVELVNDLDSVQVTLNGNKKCKVHRGFYRLWKDNLLHIREYVNKYKDKNIKIYLTGHSLGAANAIFTGLYLSKYFKDIYVENFAAPKIGNYEFIKLVDKKIKHNYTHINSNDVVTDLPPSTLHTIGDTWYYAKFNNTIVYDIQMGSVSRNHRLDTYLYGLEQIESGEIDKDLNISSCVWIRPALFLNFLIL